MGKKHAGPIVIPARLFDMIPNNLAKRIHRRHYGCQGYRSSSGGSRMVGGLAGQGRAGNEMPSTYSRPHRIDGAGAIYQKRAAILILGKVYLFIDPGERAPARPGMVPGMPLLGAYPQRIQLLLLPLPLDILGQGMGFGHVGQDIITAAVTAPFDTGRLEALLDT